MVCVVDIRGTRISDYFHEIVQLSNGAWVGELGATTFLLNNFKVVSQGYHRILPRDDGTYDAYHGGYDFHLDANGQIIC